MLKDITLGQYFPGESVMHRLDPRTKLVALIVYVVMLFVAKGTASYLLCAASAAVLIAMSRVAPRLILKSLKPVIVIVIFTAVLNMLYTPGRELVSFWIFKITAEGVYNGVFMAVRIIMLVAVTSLLTYTTSPIALTDAIEHLLSPLKKLKVPVHEFAMMMTIALRFIPTLIEETDKIMSAQKARGADFESGNLLRRAKALIPVLVPLFVSAFRRADELAVAMECRLYHGGEGRTRLNVLRFSRLDAAAAVLVICFVAGVVLLNRVSI